jgi:hypothetical protein
MPTAAMPDSHTQLRLLSKSELHELADEQFKDQWHLAMHLDPSRTLEVARMSRKNAAVELQSLKGADGARAQPSAFTTASPICAVPTLVVPSL